MKKLWCVCAVVVLSMILGAAGTAMAGEKEIWITFPNRIVGQTKRVGDVLVVVHYKENTDNKKIVLDWEPAVPTDDEGDEAAGMGGSSEENLDSLNDGIPVVRDLDLPSGKYYVFTATLIKMDGSETKVQETRFVTR